MHHTKGYAWDAGGPHQIRDELRELLGDCMFASLVLIRGNAVLQWYLRLADRSEGEVGDQQRRDYGWTGDFKAVHRCLRRSRAAGLGVKGGIRPAERRGSGGGCRRCRASHVTRLPGRGVPATDALSANDCRSDL